MGAVLVHDDDMDSNALCDELQHARHCSQWVR